MSGSEASRASWKKDEAEDRSERKLDFPVKALLVREWSELPEEIDIEGESRERSEADKLGAGLLTDSLRSDDTLDMRLICISCAVEVICECIGLCSGDGCTAWGMRGGTTPADSMDGVPGVDSCGFG
jgi:hypothetical protein